MEKKVLTEQALYFGDIKMPKNFEVNRSQLAIDILTASIQNKFPISKNFHKINNYIIEYLKAKYEISVINKTVKGFLYKTEETTNPCMDIDFRSLKDSVDYTMLYGVNTSNCVVTILYDDNRNKQQYHSIDLTSNKFIIFPSSNMYFINNKQKESFNFLLKINYRESENEFTS
jgi:hypothetical protein